MTDGLNIESPMWQSREFLQTAGRALMRWWNENHGPQLPPPAEAFRGWWKRTYDELENDWFAPSDVYESLQLHAQEARLWWEHRGKPGPPPPQYAPAPTIADSVPNPTVALGGDITLVVGLVVLALLLRSR